MKNSITKSYNRYSASELIVTGYRIVEKMENNANFPAPPASLAVLASILPEFQTAVINAKGREREAVSIKNDKRARVLECINQLAQFVTATADGDRTKLLTSGFDLYGTKRNLPVVVVDKLEVVLGSPGEATTRIKRKGGVRAYLHQCIGELPTSESVWTSEISTQPYHTFKGLATAGKYWFRVGIVNVGGQTLHSPIVQRIIQ